VTIPLVTHDQTERIVERLRIGAPWCRSIAVSFLGVSVAHAHIPISGDGGTVATALDLGSTGPEATANGAEQESTKESRMSLHVV
jgi:hypothetical protein